ncbi:unnamed protein product [Nippostrongylus brasiliensis]|uniref:EGF-like domain-containing protein n=1 Tax=Nippostrongylus brasiliensis TaxID=27835 RepID=A0A0N4YZ74_NIPBR|nr:unnamed protein product [Nippostrongylus brasiliensis]
MTFTVHSVDRSFCVDRCNELGVCYASREGPICYCDDGRIGGSCGSESFTTPSPPPSSNNYLWIIFGVVAIVGVLCAIGWIVRKLVRWFTTSSIASEQAWEWESMKVEPSAPEEEAEEGSAGGLKEQLSFSCQESVFPSWSATM